jgi:ribonucleoside-diphosphate reductase alpha chain
MNAELSQSANAVEDFSILANDLSRVNIAVLKENFPQIFRMQEDYDKYERLSALCKNKALIHPEWSLLSGRIKMRFYKKTGPQTFSESTKLLKSLLNAEYFNFIMEHSAELNSMIVSERDYTYDIFAVDTFLKSYLLRIKKDSKTVVLETPQYLFLRVATYLWFDSSNVETSLQNIHKMYTELSEGMYIQASPTLFNAGRVKSQLSSCFTMTTDDNMESITKSWRDAAFISMNSGGIGFDYSSLRHSEIGDFGSSGGIVPWIKVMNQILSTVDQCFAPDTIVYTVNKGPIPISEITPGDVCIRSDGKCTEVMRNITHVVEDADLYSISTTMNEKIIVTSKHPLFGVSFPSSNTILENISSLERGENKPAFISIENMNFGDFWICSPIPQYIKDLSFYSLDDCKMYGCMMKYCYFSENHFQLLFINEKREKFICDYLKQKGVQYSRTLYGVTFDTTHLFPFHANMFFTNGNKCIAAPFLHLPLNKLFEIVNGMFLDTESQNETFFPSSDGEFFKNCLKYICLRTGYYFRIVEDTFCISKNFSSNEQFYFNGFVYNKMEKREYDNKENHVLYDLEMVHTEEEESLTANYLTCIGTCKNGGKRKGAGACYMREWHIDIEEFLDLRKPSGAEEMRARDIFYALMISDLFMHRVETDGDWMLFCPHKVPNLENKWGTAFEIDYELFEKKALAGNIIPSRKIKARDLWTKILNTQRETGMPYILYIDAINRKSNQINLGITRLSNLCVSGDTFILTRNGNTKIRELENQKIEVWNGEEWSEVLVRKTGENISLMHIRFSNGAEIKCTPEHRFYVNDPDGKTIMVEAKDLNFHDSLIKYSLPSPKDYVSKKTNCYSYTQGFFYGKGCPYKYQKPFVIAEKKIFPHLSFQSFLRKEDGMVEVLLNDVEYFVPHNSSMDSKVCWISGFIDACGVYEDSKIILGGAVSIQLLQEFRLLCQTLGVELKFCVDKIVIEGYNIYKLNEQGLYLYKFDYLMFDEKLNVSSKNSEEDNNIRVVCKTYNNTVEDTFCFTEHKRHMGMFNGLLTGQCTEITLVSNNENIGSCNLGSIVLSSCVENGEFNFEKLEKLTRQMTRNINQVIDRNYYIEAVPEIKYTNLRNRPLGIGVQALADAFALLNITWISPEARKLNEMISETMYYAAISESIELAKIHGAYETFPGSPASKGLFQFDLWDIEKFEKTYKSQMNENPNIDLDFLKKHASRRGSCTNRYDWEKLREEMMKYGLRNSLLMAYMPTASTSNLMGKTECFEVPTQHIYTRTVLSGQYVILNTHLVKDLDDIDLWTTENVQNILKNGGSIQNLPDDHPKMKFLKEKYLTVFEIQQKVLLDMALDRGRYICQSQSFNCWMKDPSHKNLNNFHFYGWKNGAKTGMYYLRQPAKVNPVNFSIENISIPPKNSVYECEACM